MASRIILIIIIVVGGLLRFGHLADPSRGIHADEVLYGYDGLSISRTGTDHRQTGRPPLFLKGYSQRWDNRTSILYPYLLGGLFTVLTPSIWLVRLPSAVAGVAIILLTYLFARELTGRRQIGLLAAGLVAISPSAVFWSRLGHDPILAPVFLLGISWAQWRAQRQPWFWIVAAVILAVGFYTYQPVKLIGPLIFLLGLWYHRRRLKSAAAYIWVGLGLAALIVLPSVMVHLRHWLEVQGQFAAISLWHQPYPWTVLGMNIQTIFGQGYFFSNSLMFVFLLPLFIVGAWLSGRNRSPVRNFLFCFAAITLIPGLITNLDNHGTTTASRVLGQLGIMEIGVAASLSWLIDRWSRYWPRWVAGMLVPALLLPAITLTWLQYTVLPPYCCLDLVNYDQPLQVVQRPPWNTRSVIVDYRDRTMPMATLWFLQYSPSQFQSEPHDWQTINDPRGPGEYPSRFGRFRICLVAECYRPHDGALYVIPADQLPDLTAIMNFRMFINRRYEQWKIIDNT